MTRLLALLLFGVISLGLVGGFALFAVPAQTRAMTIGKHTATYALASTIRPNKQDNPELKVDALYKEPPLYSFPDMTGRFYNPEDFKGKVVFLNFWASWCGPCVEEWPGMQVLAEEFKDNPNFVMVAVNIEDDEAPIKKFLETTPTSKEVLILRDKGAKLANAFGSKMWPETYLLDTDGKILHRIVGPRNWDSPESFSYIQALLANASKN